MGRPLKLKKKPKRPAPMQVVITPDSVTLAQSVHTCPHCGATSPIIKT